MHAPVGLTPTGRWELTSVRCRSVRSPLYASCGSSLPFSFFCTCLIDVSSSATSFAHKHDAVRHVITMNSGKKYKCSTWSACLHLDILQFDQLWDNRPGTFSFMDYHDSHGTRCFLRSDTFPVLTHSPSTTNSNAGDPLPSKCLVSYVWLLPTLSCFRIHCNVKHNGVAGSSPLQTSDVFQVKI